MKEESGTRFELCHDVERVLKIGRDFQKQDSWRGAHHDTAKLLCDTIEYLRDRLNTPAGNMAATREALARIVNWFNESGWDEEAADEMDVMVEQAEAALAAPPRNCDICKNKEDAEYAYRRFYQQEMDKIPLDAVDFGKEMKRIPTKMCWLFAAATEEGAADA